MTASGLSVLTNTTLPAEMVTIIENAGFLESIPLWAVTLIRGLFIRVLSFVIILSVYGRFFKLYWKKFSQKLCRRLFGGLYDRASLCDLLGPRLHAARQGCACLIPAAERGEHQDCVEYGIPKRSFRVRRNRMGSIDSPMPKIINIVATTSSEIVCGILP